MESVSTICRTDKIKANVSELLLDVNIDNRGKLIALEKKSNLPFDIKRVYFIYDTVSGATRGYHAHRNLRQLLVAVCGSVKIRTETNGKIQTFLLDSPNKGLLIEGLVWREMMNFSQSCVLMVLADRYYDPEDYIRDYNLYTKEMYRDQK